MSGVHCLWPSRCKHSGGPCSDPSNLASCTFPTYDAPYQGHVDATAECAINPGGAACWKGNGEKNSWPHGTCCNGGGPCSDPAANMDRFIMEWQGTSDPMSESRAFYHKEYQVTTPSAWLGLGFGLGLGLYSQP